MKTLKGLARGVRRPIVGKLTRNEVPFLSRKDHVYFGSRKPPLGYAGVLSNNQPAFSFNPTPMIYAISESQSLILKDGDIVLLNPSGDINVLWDSTVQDNCLLVTKRCNCRCVMCPQPPQSDSKHLHRINKRVVDLLEPEKVERICLTGGEPTLDRKKFLEFLGLCRTLLPEAELTILTNAQPLADFHFALETATLAGTRTTFCVSLHADTADLHNRITGTKDGFKKTVLGIQNLAKLRQKIEIRFVISKLNYQRLVPFSFFVYRNFPFVVHTAFMGLEMTGWAFENAGEVWIDPPVYREELRQAVIELHRRDINVSIYNLPLCLLDRRSWRFARQSISTWKDSYLPFCADCSVREKCCGVFITSKFLSSSMAPFMAAQADSRK